MILEAITGPRLFFFGFGPDVGRLHFWRADKGQGGTPVPRDAFWEGTTAL